MYNDNGKNSGNLILLIPDHTLKDLIMKHVTPLANPYAKRPPIIAQNAEIMGRQSQQRISNTRRKYLLASNVPRKKKKGDQKTIHGELAFQPEKDCVICRGRAAVKNGINVRIPKRAHHPLCPSNQTTKGKGLLTSSERFVSIPSCCLTS